MIPIPRIRRARQKPRTPAPSRASFEKPKDESPSRTITRLEYSEHGVESRILFPEDLDGALEVPEGRVVWIDVNGLGDLPSLQRMGEVLGLHSLTIEDITQTHQRPKIEELENYLFITLRALRARESEGADDEQVSLVLFDNLLVSFQERPGNGFDPVRRRIQEGKGPIRKRGADYLLYALFDVIIDNYFPVIELYEEAMDRMDEQILSRPSVDSSHMVHHLRSELRQLRRATWPLRDIAAELSRGDVERIDPALRPAFRDCYDHSIQLFEFVEGGREQASDLAGLHLALMSDRANRVMQTLTVVATIFIPLTFVVGVYGMNFDPTQSPYNMPELRWKYGYFAILASMLVMTAWMLWLFWRKGWVGRRGSP